MTTTRQLAAISLGILFVYYEVFRWAPLGRWNWQFHFPAANDQFYPDLVIGALLLFFLYSFTRAGRGGMITACILLTLWTVVHLFDWWIPYARNLPQNAGPASFYAGHTQLLPTVGSHYPPDAGHAVLDILLFPTTLIALFATLRRQNEAKA